LRCHPPCSSLQRCVNGKCEKLALREFCQEHSDCVSDFCFSTDIRAPICSTRDCTQCPLLGLQCLEGKGEKGCYFPPYVPPRPLPESNTGTGCQCDHLTLGMESLLVIFFLFFVLAQRLRLRQDRHR
jgi:hypothetical protein